jgi:hypothetical protein
VVLRDVHCRRKLQGILWLCGGEEGGRRRILGGLKVGGKRKHCCMGGDRWLVGVVSQL